MTIARVQSRVGGRRSPKRILIDSMIVDLILATAGLLDRIREAGTRDAVVFVGTHLLRDQLSATPDAAKRGRLLAVLEALPKVGAPTSAFVLDVSRLDGGELADEATAASVDRLTTAPKLGGRADALLAITASGKADVIVTEDGTLLNRLKNERVNCDVWRFDQLRQFVEA